MKWGCKGVQKQENRLSNTSAIVVRYGSSYSGNCDSVSFEGSFTFFSGQKTSLNDGIGPAKTKQFSVYV